MKNRRPVKRYVIDGKVMEPRDLRQLHRRMLEADSISSISDELRNLVENLAYRLEMLSWYDRVYKILDTGSASENTARLMTEDLALKVVGDNSITP